jgi:hypothetical protein
MPEISRGLLDTSVLIDHDLIDADRLPDESAIAALTLAELAAGPHATEDENERARRQDRLQWAAATWDPLVKASGRTHRSRLADLLIASTAAANGLAIYTRNPSDLKALETIVDIVGI